MQLGPAGAAILQRRLQETGDIGNVLRTQLQVADTLCKSQVKVENDARTSSNGHILKQEEDSLSVLQTYFEKAMAKFLAKQGPSHETRRGLQVESDPPCSELDVDMESVGSSHDYVTSYGRMLLQQEVYLP